MLEPKPREPDSEIVKEYRGRLHRVSSWTVPGENGGCVLARQSFEFVDVDLSNTSHDAKSAEIRAREFLMNLSDVADPHLGIESRNAGVTQGMKERGEI